MHVHCFAAAFSSFLFWAATWHALAASMHLTMLAFVFMAPAETWDRATTKPACSRRSRKDQHRTRLWTDLQRLSATSIQSTNCGNFADDKGYGGPRRFWHLGSASFLTLNLGSRIHGNVQSSVRAACRGRSLALMTKEQGTCSS
jgi:hypothetical protein